LIIRNELVTTGRGCVAVPPEMPGDAGKLVVIRSDGSNAGEDLACGDLLEIETLEVISDLYCPLETREQLLPIFSNARAFFFAQDDVIEDVDTNRFANIS
jgi:hypothetical protein